MADNDQNASERALELLVYGPLGLALYVRDTVPTFLKVFVSRGRSEVQSHRRKVGDQVAGAKSLGEVAVNFGGPKVRDRVEQGLRDARQFAEQAFSGLVVPRDGEAVAPTPAPTATRDDGANGTDGERPAVDRDAQRAKAASLAIPDYDELAASQVVERLEGLPVSDLAAVREYEAAHRGRRTILFKIDQLTS